MWGETEGNKGQMNDFSLSRKGLEGILLVSEEDTLPSLLGGAGKTMRPPGELPGGHRGLRTLAFQYQLIIP